MTSGVMYDDGFKTSYSICSRQVCRADESAGTLNLGQQRRAVFAYLCQRESKPIQIRHIFVSGIRKVTARELPSAFQQMAYCGALSHQSPTMLRSIRTRV